VIGNGWRADESEFDPRNEQKSFLY
jgi:hypothetical protein